MRIYHPEQYPNSDKSERNVDMAVEHTFPASGPPSIGGVTRISRITRIHTGNSGES
jgi:hypothetical protein